MKRMTIPALALCLAAALCLFPSRAQAANSAVAAAPCVSGQHSSWTPLASQADVLSSCSSSTSTACTLRAGRYYLAADLALERALTLSPGVKLCLAGHTLTVTAGPTGSTPAVTFNGTEANPVDLCDCVGGGTLTHTLSGIYMAAFAGTCNNFFGGSISSCQGRYGAAIIYTGGALNMYDGAAITDNDCTAYPLVGGLCIQGGTFRMYGGEIARNRGCTGGGIDVNQGLASTVEIYGGSIHNNVATTGAGGGIRVFCSKFSGSTRTENAPCTVNMYGGEIRANSALNSDGGGVALCSDGAVFNLCGGTIAENTAPNGVGGGVALKYTLPNGQDHTASAINVYGGVISGNSAGQQGGGVALAAAENRFAMFGGEISGNVASAGGAAVNNGGGSTDCVFYGGSIAGLGFVTRGAMYYPFSVNGTALSSVNSTAPMSYSDENVSWSAAAQTLTVNADCTLLCGPDGTVYPWQKLRIDLNGHSVTLDDETLRCSGDLTVVDSVGTGRLIGNIETVFGAIAAVDSVTVTGSRTAVADGAPSSFDLSGGRIRNNTAGTTGGGVVVYGSSAVMTMSGGEISGNVSGSSSAERGGGVYLGSSATMRLLGGSISGNVSRHCGGGVAIGTDSTLEMSGGEISGNSVDPDAATNSNRGGGVAVGSGGTFRLTGGEVSGNKAISGGGVILNDANASLLMSGGTIRGNKAGTVNASGVITGAGGGFGGGGIGVVSSTSRAELTGGTVTENRAFAQGGGVSAYSGDVVLGGVTVSGNGCDCTTLGVGAGVFIGSIAEGAMLPANLTVNDGTVITGHSFDCFTPASGARGSAIAVNRGTLTFNGGSVTGNSVSKTDAAVSVLGCANDSSEVPIAVNGGSITGNGSDLILIGTGIRFRMTGGAVGSGSEGEPLLFRTRSEGDDMIAEITGGTVNALLDADGSGEMEVNVRSGNILSVADKSAIHLYGGNYGSSANVLARAVESGAVLEDSGVEGFPYALGDPRVPGDTNGDGKVNGKDVSMLQRFITGGYGVDLDTSDADLNHDGKVNGKDVSLLQRFIAGGYGVVLT